jgi:hypothetical protein
MLCDTENDRYLIAPGTNQHGICTQRDFVQFQQRLGHLRQDSSSSSSRGASSKTSVAAVVAAEAVAAAAAHIYQSTIS